MKSRELGEELTIIIPELILPLDDELPSLSHFPWAVCAGLFPGEVIYKCLRLGISNFIYHMKTSIDLPEELISEAMRISGSKSKIEAIKKALQKMN